MNPKPDKLARALHSRLAQSQELTNLILCTDLASWLSSLEPEKRTYWELWARDSYEQEQALMMRLVLSGRDWDLERMKLAKLDR